jgi:hypothetical protein
LRTALVAAAAAATLIAACGTEPEPLHFAPPPKLPPALPAPTRECAEACLDRFFMLTSDDVVHVFDARDAESSANATELATFAAPAGTTAISVDGTRLLAMSPAGVDALDVASGAPLAHVADLSGLDLAAVNGHVGVAIDPQTVRFVDGAPDLHADAPIGQLFVYRGDFAYLTPADADGNGEMHILLGGADVDTDSGWGPHAPLGSDGGEVVITFSPVVSALFLMDLIEVDPHENASSTSQITSIPTSWHLVDIAVATSRAQ